MINIYHPNKGNTGSACSFSDSIENDCVFAAIVKQSGWDETTRIGSFKESLEDKEKNIRIKLGEHEVAAIIDCLERNRPFTTYHKHENSPKGIQFVPWISKPLNDGDKPTQNGFTFGISVTDKSNSDYKNNFFIGFTFAEGRLLKEYLVNCLNSHFNKNREKFLNTLNKGT